MSTCAGPGRSGVNCGHATKYTFEGNGRREDRCGWHAYPWLGNNVPDWVEHIYIRGKQTQYKKAV